MADDPLPAGFTHDDPPPTGFTADQPGSEESAPGGWRGAVRSTAEDFLRGLNAGAAGDVVGAGQIAANVLPSWMTGPVARSSPAQSMTNWANTPTPGVAGTVGRGVGAAAPFMAMPATGLGAMADAAIGGGLAGGIQPTPSGSLAEHGIGALAGAATGGAFGALGGTAAQQAMRDLGIRIPPGRMVPLLGKEWERFTSHLPILNRVIGHGRQISLDDFNRVLYEDALQPLRQLNIPLATPAGRGSAGLDQLRTTITDRLNNVLSRSELPTTAIAGLRGDLSTIMNDARKDMSGDTLRRFGEILRDDVVAPITENGGRLPGSRLAGTNGVIARINNRSRGLWRSQDPQDKALGAALDKVEDTLLNNATIGAGGAPELDAARQAYARYKTLIRSGSGAKAEGYVDPDSLTAELRRTSEDLFARGGMRLQPLARQAKRAGVPTTGETHPLLSAWETGVAGGAAYLEPRAWWAATPAALYNRPGMSTLGAVANQASQLGRAAGTAAGQAAPSAMPPTLYPENQP